MPMEAHKHRDVFSSLGDAGLLTRMLPPRRRCLLVPLISLFTFPCPELSV